MTSGTILISTPRTSRKPKIANKRSYSVCIMSWPAIFGRSTRRHTHFQGSPRDDACGLKEARLPGHIKIVLVVDPVDAGKIAGSIRDSAPVRRLEKLVLFVNPPWRSEDSVEPVNDMAVPGPNYGLLMLLLRNQFEVLEGTDHMILGKQLDGNPSLLHCWTVWYRSGRPLII